SLKKVFQEYFGFTPLRVNSLNMAGKKKKFKGMIGTQDNFKKFYVKLPEGATLESLAG
ncbi:MAG: 50S ribosomal protein L23, partial [Bacteroidota bacterium]